MTEISPAINLSLNMKASQIPNFLPLLQQGVKLKIQVGSSIKMVLCEQFGLDPDYVEERIKTIFLDGTIVDDLNTAVIKEGSSLALSAAMPGLAGATLRRAGLLASLRSQITHLEDIVKDLPRREGFMILKLFNLLVRELGPVFLKKGIYMTRNEFEDFFKTLPEEIWENCPAPRVEGQEVNVENLRRMKWLGQHDRVRLQVDFF